MWYGSPSALESLLLLLLWKHLEHSSKWVVLGVDEREEAARSALRLVSYNDLLQVFGE